MCSSQLWHAVHSLIFSLQGRSPRIATVIVYLNEDATLQGGETAFTQAGRPNLLQHMLGVLLQCWRAVAVSNPGKAQLLLQLVYLQAPGYGGIQGLSACADGFVAVKPRRGKQHTPSNCFPSPLHHIYVYSMGRPCYCAYQSLEAMSAAQVTRCCSTPSSQTAARTMHPYTRAAQCCRVSSGQQQNGQSDWIAF